MIKRRNVQKLTIFLLIMAFLTGCAAKEPSENPSGGSSDGKVAVADWGSGGLKLLSQSRLVGDVLYYTDGKWDEERKQLYDTVVYRKQEGLEPEEAARLAQEELLAYAADQADSVYLFYRESDSEESAFGIRKVSGEGDILFEVTVESQDQEIIAGLSDVCAGEADQEGKLYLTNLSGDVFVFDSDGRLSYVKQELWDTSEKDENTVNLPATQKMQEGSVQTGLVNTGKSGIYAYQAKGRNLTLSKISETEENNIRQIELPAQSQASLTVFSGFDSGVLVADSDELWRYDVEEKALIRLLSWGDERVNLKDYTVESVGMAKDGALWVYVYRSSDDAALVQIAQKSREEIREKQSVKLALLEAEEGSNQESYNTMLEEMAASFNRVNTAYQVECVTYPSMLALQTAILKGEGPDVFDFGYGRLEIRSLIGKGVLENLSPYFAKSSVVTEEDLLPSVRRAGTIDGELVCVLPFFTVEGFAGKGALGVRDGWTAEQYLELGQANPKSVLFDYDLPQDYRNGVLRILLTADMDRYIDWEEGKCYFDQEYFISILDSIKKLPAPDMQLVDSSALAREGRLTEMFDILEEKMASGELLTRAFWASGIEYFNNWKKDGYFGSDEMDFAGYPNEEGKPYYGMNCEVPLGMNSASKNKEGAWAFLEYLLSSEYQELRSYNGFPARRDSFDKHISQEKVYGGRVDVNLTKEDRDAVRMIAENAYWSGTSSTLELIWLIQEEAGDVWAGDKTSAQAAEIIQSRVELYVSEQ